MSNFKIFSLYDEPMTEDEVDSYSEILLDVDAIEYMVPEVRRKAGIHVAVRTKTGANLVLLKSFKSLAKELI